MDYGLDRRLWERISYLFFNCSVYLAVLCVVLVSFDVFPWTDVPFFPPRPSYFLGILGMIFFLASLQWTKRLLHDRGILILTFLFLAIGAYATWRNALPLGEKLFTFAMRNYIKWQVIPICFLLWFAMLFSLLPRERAKKLFFVGIVILFCLNAAHCLGEILANAGCSAIKNFLVTINPWFRMEAIAHGWWPAVFWEGRIRGLFAEPSFLGFALLVFCGFFFYKNLQNRYYTVLIFFIFLCMVLGKIRFAIMGFIFYIIYISIHFYNVKRKTFCIYTSIILVFFIYALVQIKGSPLYDSWKMNISNIEKSAIYCREMNHGNLLPHPVMDWKPFPGNVFNRITAAWLDIIILLDRIWGAGFFLRGFYLMPLDECAFFHCTDEVGLWIRQAANDPFRGLPRLSEYTTIGAEYGIFGLAALFLLYGYIAFRAHFFCKRTHESYALAMLGTYYALLILLLGTASSSTFLFFFFTGFLYAVTGPEAAGQENC